jgi:hypothetical protein
MRIPIDQFICNRVNGTLVILNPKIGVCYTLNTVGMEIWEGLLNNQEIEIIAKLISEKYGQDFSVVKNDVIELIQELREEGLVV